VLLHGASINIQSSCSSCSPPSWIASRVCIPCLARHLHNDPTDSSKWLPSCYLRGMPCGHLKKQGRKAPFARRERTVSARGTGKTRKQGRRNGGGLLQ
jgi:hypothetical protein